MNLFNLFLWWNTRNKKSYYVVRPENARYFREKSESQSLYELQRMMGMRNNPKAMSKNLELGNLFESLRINL